MKHTFSSRNLSVIRFAFAFALFLTWSPFLSAQTKPATAEDAYLSENPLIRVGVSMARGNFEQAHQLIEDYQTQSEQFEIPQPLDNLLTQYENLQKELKHSRQEAYQEHIDKMQDQIRQAQWRESLLHASRQFDFELEEKTEFEQTSEEKAREAWLEALSEMATAVRLAERMDMDEQIAPLQKSLVIDKTTAIADVIEEEGKKLDAYNKVYYYLSVVDEDEFDFDDLHRRLVREETIKAIYAPDPNTEGVSWKERREGITAEMITTAMAIASLNYVDTPDYVEMGNKGVENCLILVETNKVGEFFDELQDQQDIEDFVGDVKLLWERYKPVIEESDDFRYLYFLMDGILQLNQKYLGLPDEIILAEFAEGAFSALDSYTYVVWPGDVKDFNKSMTNEFSGIGIVIKKHQDEKNPEYNDALRIDSLVSYEGGAYKAGLDAGDLILAVDGKDIRTITLEKAVRLITGPPGTEVTLTVYRDEFEKPREFTVTRNHIVVPTVKGLYYDDEGDWEHFLDPDSGIAYVRLTHFSGETPGSLREKLRELKTQDMNGLILDLRSNSGGYLSGAVDIVDTFIDHGKIVSARYRNPQTEQTHRASSATTFDPEMPLVVLINSASASASEIVAGALKDHERATIIGTRSFGKGNVQTIQELLPTKAQLKMTVAYYYLPSGRRVHRDPDNKKQEDYGVLPDIEVELTSSQIEDYINVWHDAEVLHRDDLSETERKWERIDREQLLEKDPQLNMALLNLRAHLWVAENASRTFLAGSEKKSAAATPNF